METGKQTSNESSIPKKAGTYDSKQKSNKKEYLNIPESQELRTPDISEVRVKVGIKRGKLVKNLKED